MIGAVLQPQDLDTVMGWTVMKVDVRATRRREYKRIKTKFQKYQFQVFTFFPLYKLEFYEYEVDGDCPVLNQFPLGTEMTS